MYLPQYSIRFLLGLFVVFALCLALARLEAYFAAMVLLAYVIIVACLVNSPVVKRALVWGPVLGSCIFLAIGQFALRVGIEPPLPFQEPRPIEGLVARYAVSMGGFVGGVVGLLVAGTVNSERAKAGCGSAGVEQNDGTAHDRSQAASASSIAQTPNTPSRRSPES